MLRTSKEIIAYSVMHNMSSSVQVLPVMVRITVRPAMNCCKCDTEAVIYAAQGTVTKVKGFENGLKEALLTKGPMTVSVDAGSESFRFYKRGIYNNTACHTVPVTGDVKP